MPKSTWVRWALLFRLQQCVERKSVRTIVAKIIGAHAVCKIKLALPFVAAGRAQPLEVAHNQWIIMFEGIRINAKRSE